MHSQAKLKTAGVLDSANRDVEAGGFDLTSRQASTQPKVSIVTVVRNRASELLATMASVRAQTYPNIEYIVIDGASTDGTIDAIKGSSDVVNSWVSEPDSGIYDAINKGIARASGTYIAILHAGDSYAPDFVASAVACASRNPNSIVYCGHIRGASPIGITEPEPGVLLHYLGLNISAFLVPRTIYQLIGDYSLNYRIVSDHIWIRDALTKGVPFTRFDGHLLTFAEGGASSAATPEHVRQIVAENVSAFRRIFPFLPETVCEAVYLYRFDDAHADAILTYLRGVPVRSDIHPDYPLFLQSLSSMLAYLWPLRGLQAAKEHAQSRFVAARLELAKHLNIPVRETNIFFGADHVAHICRNIDSLAAAKRNRHVVLHYLEVFSRRSETFVSDLLAELSTREGEFHVVLCDKRVLQSERPYKALFAFDYEAFDEPSSRIIIDHFLDALSPGQFIFHFATNGWRLLKRLGPKHQALPSLYMTHGIDVFDLRADTAYTRFINEIACKQSNATFSAVSDYLKSALVAGGVPVSKISLIPNSVHPRFLANRVAGRDKIDARQRSGFDFRVINVGRLIRWKGHEILVRAVGILKGRYGINARLTIVYGDEDREKSRLSKTIKDLGLANQVELRASVNFDEEPGFYSDFDVLASASTYTADTFNRSETFGMSILEGIASGLPVVVTNAGGQAEVTGPDGRFARVVQHGDAESMARALADMYRSGAIDDDNIVYAQSRLSIFSAERRMAELSKIIDRGRESQLRVAVVSTGTSHGAGAAAHRVHRSLLASGVNSHLYKRSAGSDAPGAGVVPLSPSAIVNSDRIHPTGSFIRPGHTIFSIDPVGLDDGVIDEIVEKSDVINVHWSARFLSIGNIGRLTRSGKPVVMTIRDMHPLTGGCHFFHGCDNWKHSCLPCPQFLPENVHLPHALFKAKREQWDTKNVTVVVLSEHTRRIVEQSPLLGHCRIEKIYNTVETEIFHPRCRQSARDALRIPRDKRVIAYLPSYGSRIKGLPEAEAALELLARKIGAENCVVLCAGAADHAVASPFQCINLGFVDGKDQLAELYAAADVTLIASLEETFSNTAVESIACGTPIAGFSTGAIGELAADGRGASVPVGDVHALAEAINDLFSRDIDRSALHGFVKSNMSMEIIGNAYRDLFRELSSAACARLPDGSQLQNENTADAAGASLAYMTARLQGTHGGASSWNAASAPNRQTRVFRILRGVGRRFFHGEVPPWGKQLGNFYLAVERRLFNRRAR